MPIKARLAYSKNFVVSFTPRGRRTDLHTRGYVRINGKTVNGVLYNGISEKIFYADGIHADMAFNAAQDNRKQFYLEAA
jgi:hypothetical protein